MAPSTSRVRHTRAHTVYAENAHTVPFVTLCENLARVTPSESMSSETRVAHACYVLIKSRGTASSPAVVVPVDMLAP